MTCLGCTAGQGCCDLSHGGSLGLMQVFCASGSQCSANGGDFHP